MKPLYVLAFLLVSSAQLFASAPNPTVPSVEEKRQLIKAHNSAFVSLNEMIRDPWVMKGPDGYFYLTGTTAGSHWGDTIGIRLWRSKDLAYWEDLGFVWDLMKDGKAQNSWHFSRPIKQPELKNPLAVWAPEIHFINDNWWIPHSLNVSGHGLLRSTTGKPEGPYEAMPMMSGRGIDAHLFQDGEDVYYLWQADLLAKLTPDMSKLAEPESQLSLDGKHPLGYEGILILKIGDKYLNIASGRYGYELEDTYDLYYTVGKSIKGPFGKRRIAIKNAGHGNLVQDNNGKWWASAFDHPYMDKKTMTRWNFWLVPVDIKETDDDIIFNVKDARFKPTKAEEDEIDRLAIEGSPATWKGKTHWWRPTKP